VVHAGEDHLARDRIPVSGLIEHVEIGVAAVHLRRTATPLAGQLVRIVGLSAGTALGKVIGALRIEGHGQRSRWAIAASSASAPTRMSDPGASSGGPMTRL
jgi:hypothetical protein